MPDRGTGLVTGAAGLIGSAVIWALNERGTRASSRSIGWTGARKWRNLSPLRFDDYLEADALGDKIELGLLDDVRAVIHLGACSATTETDGRYLIENNFNYTKMRAEWALQRGIRFAYASSAATYGAIEGRVSDGLDITTLRPLNMYGYSKQLFDLHASTRGHPIGSWGEVLQRVRAEREPQGRHAERGEQVVPADPGNGPRGAVQERSPEFAHGEQLWDFLNVKDAVEMTLGPGRGTSAHGLYNIGPGESTPGASSSAPPSARLNVRSTSSSTRCRPSCG